MIQKELTEYQSDGQRCPVCERSFSSYENYAIHHGHQHDGNPLVTIHGEERLKRLYINNSPNEIAERLGVSRPAVNAAIELLDIERRGRSEAEHLKNQDKSLEERREQTRKARQKHTEKFGDGGHIAKWVSENKQRHREVSQKHAALGAEARDENGMGGVTGQEHPAWRGGKSIYDAVKRQLHGPSWDNIRERVREDADHECEMCGKPASEIDHRGLDVHHIVPIMCGGTNGDWNLMALCATCHRTTEVRTRELLDPVLDAVN